MTRNYLSTRCKACGAPFVDYTRADRVRCHRCWLPAAPFVAWIRTVIAGRDQDYNAAAGALGMTRHVMERHLKEIAEYAHVDTIDRACCNAGQPEMFRELYESWYAEEYEDAGALDTTEAKAA